jgi:glycosyltransferase involved in cell wall biosynthesis
MEGLGAGCAVVSSEVSGVEDLLSDSAAEGLVRLYPVGDTDLAAQQISDSLFNYSEETEKNAMLLADRYFSIQNCVENYKDLIERLEFNSNELITVGLFFKIKVKFSGLIVSFRYLKYKLLS